MKVKVMKLVENAVLPMKAHPSDAGADLTVTSVEFDSEHDVYTYHSGIAMEIPEGHVGLLFPRSSIYSTGLSLTNCVGVIDANYRGEVTAKMRKSAFNVEAYEVGDRFCQVIVMPIPSVQFTEAKQLSNTDRGTGGYGSSGRKFLKK